MKRLVLTDALIREALTPDPHVTAPAGLLAQITADVARTRSAGRSGSRRCRSRAGSPGSVGAATLLALLGTLLVAGGSRNPFEAFLPPAQSPLLQRLPVRRPLGPRSRPSARTRPGRATARTGCGTGPRPAGPGRSRRAPPALLEPATSATWPACPTAASSSAPTAECGWETRTGGPGWPQSRAGALPQASRGSSGRPLSRADSISRRIARSTGAGARRRTRAPQAASSSQRLPTVRSGRPASATRAEPGIARLSEGDCGEVLPWGDGATHDVTGIATGREGRVAIAIMDIQAGDLYPGGRIMTWDGERWTTLRDGPEVRSGGLNGLSYGPDGSLWAAFDRRLWRYADGAETSVRSDVGQGPVSVAPDGTVWFVAQDAATGTAFVDRLLPGARWFPSLRRRPTPRRDPRRCRSSTPARSRDCSA